MCAAYDAAIASYWRAATSPLRSPLEPPTKVAPGCRDPSSSSSSTLVTGNTLDERDRCRPQAARNHPSASRTAIPDQNVGMIVLVSLASVAFGALLGHLGSRRLQSITETRKGRAACRVLYFDAADAARLLGRRTPAEWKPPEQPPIPAWPVSYPVVADHMAKDDLVVVREAFTRLRNAIPAQGSGWQPMQTVDAARRANHGFAVSAAILHAYGWPPPLRRLRALFIGGILMRYATDRRGRLDLVDDLPLVTGTEEETSTIS